MGPTKSPVLCVFHGGKWPGLTLATHPNLVSRLKKEYSYTFTPILAFMACSRVKLTFKGVEVIGERKRLHHEEFNALCSSPNTVTVME